MVHTYPHNDNSKFKKRQGNSVDAYLKTFSILEDLEDRSMLVIDLVNLRVQLDYRVHMEFMFDDKKYLNFFDKIRALMNYRRGYLQSKKVLQAEDRIDFTVVRMEDVHLLDGVETDLADLFDARPEQNIQVISRPEILLVGYVQNDQIDYAPYEEEKGAAIQNI